MKKFVALDANILLDFYSFPKDEIQKLMAIFDSDPVTKEVEFLIVPHIEQEWRKNRSRKIEVTLKQFRKELDAIKRLPIPTVIKYSEFYEEIEEAKNKLKVASEAAIQSSLDAALKHELEADKLIAKILQGRDPTHKLTLQKLQNQAFENAHRRTILDYPPGKANAIGDRLVWESLLLADFLNEQDIYLVTSDEDFYSPLWKKENINCSGVDALTNFNMRANEFLRHEWKRRKKGEFYVLGSILCLLEMLEAPDVQGLLHSKRRRRAVRKLRHSMSFQETHAAIAGLQTFEDFSESELENLVDAFLENDQIYRIIEDSDVRNFGFKLLELAKMYSSNQELQQKAKTLSDLLIRGHRTPIHEDMNLPF